MKKKYYPYCIAVAATILNNNEDAREAVNDAMLSVWNSIPPAKPEHLRAYLATVVRHSAIDIYRKLHNRRNEAVTGAVPLDSVADASGGEDFVTTIAISNIIDRFLDTLPEKENMIFVARFYFNEPIDLIASRFGMPAGSVKTVIRRLKKKLKSFLDEEGVSV